MRVVRAFAFICVPAGSPSRGKAVTVYVFDVNQPSLPIPFYSVLLPVSVLMTSRETFTSARTRRRSLTIFRSAVPVLCPVR